MKALSNPWHALPQHPEYLLEVDAPFVLSHNALRNETHRFQLHVLPEPFMGLLHAPVVLLNLNPGYVPQDVADYGSDRRSSMMRESTVHGLEDDDAFYFLSDEFSNLTPAAGTGGARN